MKRSEEKSGAGEMQVSSEPCKPTTSVCARPTHFVRRKRKKDIRSAVVPVRFTEAERNTVMRFAEVRKLSLSDFIRTVVLGRKLPATTPPQVNLSTYQELARIGNNLNQLLRAANSGMVMNVDLGLLQKLASQLRALSNCLLQSRA